MSIPIACRPEAFELFAAQISQLETTPGFAVDRRPVDDDLDALELPPSRDAVGRLVDRHRVDIGDVQARAWVQMERVGVAALEVVVPRVIQIP